MLKDRNEEIGKRIKQQREALGLTQSQLAEMIDKEDPVNGVKGVSEVTIRNWEKGTKITINRLEELSKIFDCDISFLLGESGEFTRIKYMPVNEYLGLDQETIKVLKENYIIRDILSRLVEHDTLFEYIYFYVYNDTKEFKDEFWYKSFLESCIHDLLDNFLRSEWELIHKAMLKPVIPIKELKPTKQVGKAKIQLPIAEYVKIEISPEYKLNSLKTKLTPP